MTSAPSSAHHLFLVALVCGTAVMLAPLWMGWPAPGDALAAGAARGGFAGGALCLGAASAGMVWHWRRQADRVLARYRLWTAIAIGGWAAAWAVASLAVAFA